jgi:two-component system sensor histidine kinase BarA
MRHMPRWFIMDFVIGSQSKSERIPRLKVLVVDDDLLSLHLMQVLLRRAGHQVSVAANGREACEAVKRQQFDVVLMDLQMAGMDGLETSRHIREAENGKQRVLIVALTASYFVDGGQKLFEAGIDDYIAKPFDLEQLSRMWQQRAESLSLSTRRQLPPGEAFDL